MILRGKKLLCLLLFLDVVGICATYTKQESQLYHVRVLIDQADAVNTRTWQISCPQGCIVYDPSTNLKTKSAPIANLTIEYGKDGLYINKKKSDAKKLVIAAKNNDFLSFNGTQFYGFFIIHCESGIAYAINSVDLEDYVACVLRTESWPGWPLEVNKAFAIACRTYVVGVIMMNKNSHSVSPYHVKNTNRHQTYHGRHENPILYQAAQETRGVFLAYKGNPIVAMFDSCCGGIVPAQVDGINFDHAPYLKRDYACTFCKGCRSYSWKAEYDLRNLEGLLNPVVPLKGLKEIKISKKDKAGIAHELIAKDSKGSHVILEKQLYYALDNVRSFYYTMTQKGSKVYFAGRGMGHHIGLCQWGAREMVNRGYTYRKILEFYYPGTTFMRFY